VARSLLVSPGTDKVSYLRAHEVEVSRLREYLCYHLAEFFDQPNDYFVGPPPRSIDGFTFTHPKDFFDWTFEVRYEQDVPIAGTIVYLGRPLYDDVLELIASEDIDFPEDQIEPATRPGVAAQHRAESLALSHMAGHAP
jgi:hypothetical protein